MEYTIKLSEQVLQTVLECMAAQPYRVVAPIIADIQRQIEGQAQQRLTVIPGGTQEGA